VSFLRRDPLHQHQFRTTTGALSETNAVACTALPAMFVPATENKKP
jgi:hypothetical protein